MDHLTSPDARGIRLARPDVGEEELAAIAEVFRSGILTDGPATLAFERAFAAYHQVENAVAFANGTVALTAIYLGLGIGPGDEVIVPSMTFISTATSVLHIGATPVFADIEPDTFNIDPADVARRITPATKAIVAVHYGGQAADLDGLRAVADDAHVLLIEDAAEAHGATYRGRPVGGFGRAAMFSFTPTKNITTGEGGMVTTDDGDLAERLRLLRNHGQPSPGHHVLVGFNWRLSEMQAAMGNAQLAKLPGILERKQAHAENLTKLLAPVPGIIPPAVRPDCRHVYMLYTILVGQGRDELREALAERRIESRVYFPPAHLQPIFAPARTDLPITDDVAGRMLSLPIHAQLPPSDIDAVGETIADLAAPSTAGVRPAPAHQ